MSKSANAGELRTKAYFKRIERGAPDADGYQPETECDVFGGAPVMCKWANAHGNEVFLAMQQQLKDPATLTVRYSPLLDDVTLVVYHDGDPGPYEVISVDNVDQRCEWLEIKLHRKVGAR